MATTLLNFGPELDKVLANTTAILAGQATIVANQEKIMTATTDTILAVAGSFFRRSSFVTDVGLIVGSSS